jgi:hypothetical protein
MTEKGFPLRAGYLTTPLHKLPIFEARPCPVADKMFNGGVIVTDIVAKPESEVIKWADALEETILS